MQNEIYRLHAAVCKIMAHPKRLEIINALRRGPATLSALAAATAMSKPNLSQHLGQMSERGIVERRRDGAEMRYRIANLKIIKACDIMREVLLEQLEKHRAMADELRPGAAVKPRRPAGRVK